MQESKEIPNIEICRGELMKAGAFNLHTNKVVQKLVSTLDKNTPQHMAEAISIYSLGAFINSFNCKIKLGCNDTFPMSLIFLILAKSGSNKTSSINKTTQAFSNGYEMLDAYRKMLLEEKLESSTGETVNGIILNPIQIKLGTAPGLIHAMNKFQDETLGAPAIVVDEFATELKTSLYFEESVGIIAEVFDNGNLPSRAMKSHEAQSRPVKGMAVTVIFIGAEFQLINDSELLSKLESEMVTKFSRRSFFIYPDFEIVTKTSIDVKDLLRKEYAKEENVDEVLEEVRLLSSHIAKRFIDANQDVNMIDIEDDARDLYVIYKTYCNEKALLLEDGKLELEQKDRHWRAIKLAGVFAIANQHEQIMKQDLLEAISFAESLVGYMENFTEKSKELPHEKLVNICTSTNNVPSPHKIIKMGLASNEKELKELFQFANSKLNDSKSGYIVRDSDTEMMVYKKYEESNLVGLSYKMSEGTKEERKYSLTNGYKYREDKFESVSKIMSNDTAYAAFEFKDGTRGKNNIIGKTNLIILDIDESDYEDIDVSGMLVDYKHIICRTSNAENPYKFRIALQSDIMIDLDSQYWGSLLTLIGKDLGLTVDKLAKSQVYYGYANRKPLIELEGDLYPVSELIGNIEQKLNERKKFSIGDVSDIWIRRYEVFRSWYDTPAKKLGKHLSLYACAERGMQANIDISTMIRIIKDIDDQRDSQVRNGFIDTLEKTLEKKYGEDEK